ncbi:hypothetical protein H5410_064404 [Solanum commersonii]|uniref:F-box domain-containing protein n=1 Tax=Solanum commersonii TaxID=4109 RepID=A0A9J5VZH7_SOLCO|nr:hypothetical protein H5410_064404 [Solanum commersonii]
MDIHLPEEIVMDTLSRLPVQSLLRFKCVSKSWKKLIVEPYFTRKHLKNNQNSQKFLSCRTHAKDGVLSYYCSSLSSIQLVEFVQKLDWPPNFKPWHVKIYCYFNGLSIMRVSNYGYRDIFLLSNPFTRESIVVSNSKFPPKGLLTYGMCYDSTTDDYKVLKIDVDRYDLSKYYKECFVFPLLFFRGGAILNYIWLMKKYGVKASWTEFIQDTGLILTIPKNGEVLLRCIDGESWVVFMTSNGQVGLWPLRLMNKDGFISTESLISPKLLI